MPVICPVCSKNLHSYQGRVECTTCSGWVHHGNKLKCSGLTETEFSEHINDVTKPFECDHCVNMKIAQANNSVFVRLPFPVECEDNIFGAPPEMKKRKPDVSSMSPSQLKKFVSEMEAIDDQLEKNDEEELLTATVNSKYYNLRKFKSLKFDSSKFALLHVNIASLNKHFEELQETLCRLGHSFDVIGISEYKISDGNPPSNNISLPGYDKFIFEPTKTTHGGTGFYMKNGLDYITRDDMKLNSPDQFEAMFVEIILPDRKNLVVGCVYRHPSGSIRDFTNDHLEPILHKISKEKKECVLMGDFNVNLLNTNGNSAATDFYNSLTSYFFTPFILQPTRLHAKTLIDNIFLNSLEYTATSGNVLREISDHLIQFLILEGFTKERSLPETTIYKRDMSNFSEREFEETVINGLNWEEICMLRFKDPDVAIKSFHKTVEYQFDEMSPFKKLTLKEYRLMLKPWITKEILTKCDARDELLKSIKNETDPAKIDELRKKFTKMRNEITQEKRNGKREFHITQFEKNKDKSSSMWNSIRKLVNVKSSKKSTIKLMIDDDIVSDPSKIANIFNDHFSSLGNKVQQKIPIEQGSYNSYLYKKKQKWKIFHQSRWSYIFSYAYRSQRGW